MVLHFQNSNYESTKFKTFINTKNYKMKLNKKLKLEKIYKINQTYFTKCFPIIFNNFIFIRCKYTTF